MRISADQSHPPRLNDHLLRRTLLEIKSSKAFLSLGEAFEANNNHPPRTRRPTANSFIAYVTSMPRICCIASSHMPHTPKYRIASSYCIDPSLRRTITARRPPRCCYFWLPPSPPWLGFLNSICIYVCTMTLTATWVIFHGCRCGVEWRSRVVCFCQQTLPFIPTRRPPRCCYFWRPPPPPWLGF